MKANPRDLAEVRALLAKRKTVSMAALRILGGMLRQESADACIEELVASGELVESATGMYRVVRVEQEAVAQGGLWG